MPPFLKPLGFTCALLLTLLPAQPAAQAALGPCTRLQTLPPARFAAQVGARKLAFFARDLANQHCYQLHPTLAAERHAPWSSFKIPNLLIALETGVAPSLDHRLPWDSTRRPRADYWPADWAQAQTLQSAFTRSAAWYFQDLAREIGGPRYRPWLKRFGYGNQNAKDGDDAFWLNGALRISAQEQAQFLARLLSGDAGVSARSLGALDQVSLLKQAGGYALHGKTGSGPVYSGRFDGPFEGWLVGYVKRPQQAPLVYALYVQGANYAAIRGFRQEMSETLLQATGAWPGRQ